MSEQSKALVRRVFEAVAARDLDALDELVHPEVEYHGMEVKGLENLKAKMAEMYRGFPDLVVDIEDIVAEGEKVVVRLVGRGTHTGEFEGIPATGRQMEAPEFDLFRLEDGKIAEVWHLYDALGVMQQLGVLPQPEAAGERS